MVDLIKKGRIPLNVAYRKLIRSLYMHLSKSHVEIFEWLHR